MAIILNKHYREGDAEALAADLQNLWEFKKVETSTNDYGAVIKLWVTDYTYLEVSSTNISPQISVYHHDLLVKSAVGSSSGGSAIYAARTNRALILTYQGTNTTAVSTHGNHIMIGTAENPQTGAEETAVCYEYYDRTSGGNDRYSRYMCASDTSKKTILPYTITYTGGTSRKTVLIPWEMDETAFMMKDVYRLSQPQISPFIGDCTLNGRKFFSLGTVLAEDD